MKDKDSNSDKYKEKHGATSWECDALTPEIIQDLLETKIREIIDVKDYEFMIYLEDKEKKQLGKLAADMKNREKLRQVLKNRKHSARRV